MRVYLDESGDLGWKFAHPFRNGGSSRYLCLALMFLPDAHRKLPKRIVADMYRRYGWVREQKASDCTRNIKFEFFKAANQLLVGHPDIEIDCIVVNKQNVQEHIRRDGNKLYNFMCKLVIEDHAARIPNFTFVPDKRSIKVESGNSLSDYLQTMIWFDLNLPITLTNDPQESHKNYNLQFVDFVANAIWSHFEDGENEVYQEAIRRIRLRKLFF